MYKLEVLRKYIRQYVDIKTEILNSEVTPSREEAFKDIKGHFNFLSEIFEWGFRESTTEDNYLQLEVFSNEGILLESYKGTDKIATTLERVLSNLFRSNKYCKTHTTKDKTASAETGLLKPRESITLDVCIRDEQLGYIRDGKYYSSLSQVSSNSADLAIFSLIQVLNTTDICIRIGKFFDKPDWIVYRVDWEN